MGWRSSINVSRETAIAQITAALPKMSGDRLSSILRDLYDDGEVPGMYGKSPSVGNHPAVDDANEDADDS